MEPKATAPKKKRLGKNTIRALAWASGAAAFALPWAAFQVAPVTTAAQSQQVVVVPAGSRVVVTRSAGGATNVQVVRSKGTVASAPITTTRASAPPKI